MISIVLVTYNRAERLKLSIQDIIDQSFSDFELIICDDCSPDHTQQICEEFARRDLRIKYFRHQENKRMPENLNYGIKQAQYKYIAILHDGDRFNKDLLLKWYAAINESPSIGFVFNDIGQLNSNEELIKHKKKSFAAGHIKRKFLLEEVFFRTWGFGSPIWGEAFVLKSALEEVNYLDPEFGFYADVDLWMKLLAKYDAFYIDTPLICTPTQEIQPRLFDNGHWKVFNILRRMHYVNRLRYFSNHKVRLFKELIIYIFYVLKTLILRPLLLSVNDMYKKVRG